MNFIRKWQNGFICASCGNDHSYEIKSRHLCECTQCKKQTSVTAGMLFHGSRITLIQWFYTKLIKFFPTQRELKGLEARH